jgi:hypothetical protein
VKALQEWISIANKTKKRNFKTAKNTVLWRDVHFDPRHVRWREHGPVGPDLNDLLSTPTDYGEVLWEVRSDDADGPV